MNVGIHGIGSYLPPQVRRNDWWPSLIVEQWREKAIANILRAQRSQEVPATDGQRRTLAAIAELSDDPFQGCRERRVIADGMLSVEMETIAAREALARAEVDPSEIDLLLTYSTTPQFALAPECGALHRALGLPRACMSTVIDGVCNAFAMQLTFASQMIACGKARYALLVQACAHTRFSPVEDPTSALFGDAATAIVVGPVAERHGLLSYVHGTDGDFHRGLVLGVPNGTWYDTGRPVPWSPDPKVGRTMVMNLADWAKESVEAALREAGLNRNDVDFYASHQGTKWLRQVTHDYIGFERARAIDTFEYTGSVMPCNVPLQLEFGEREGLIGDGSVVATFTGGGGVTWSGMVLRWGGA